MQYPSIVQQGADSKYTCVVADGAVAGAAGPVFLVVTADAPGRQWLTQSPQTVWQQIHGQVGCSQLHLAEYCLCDMLLGMQSNGKTFWFDQLLTCC